MSPWASVGLRNVPLGCLSSAEDSLESTLRWPECSHLPPGSMAVSLWICGIALCKPEQGPMQASASSMTPALHPRNSFQEPSQTHFLLCSS